MELEWEFSKSVYKSKLNNLLSEIIYLDCSENKSTCRIALTECQQKRHGSKSIYDFMMPRLLFNEWVNLYKPDCDNVNIDKKVKECLKRLQQITLTWTIPLYHFEIYNSTVLLQVCKESLTKQMINSYSFTDDKVKNLDIYKPVSNKVIITYLSSTASDIRTLLLASLFSAEDCHKFIYISKSDASLSCNNLALISQLLNLNIEWRNKFHCNKNHVVYETLKESEFFHQGENSFAQGYLLFEDSALKDMKKWKNILNTKLILTDGVLEFIMCIANELEHATNEYSTKDQAQDHFKVLHLGSHGFMLFSRQIYLASLIYYELKTKCDLSLMNLHFDCMEIFHGSFDTILSPQGILQKYTEDISYSFKSKYGENQTWTPLVSTIACSVLKLDILTMSLSSPIKRDMESNGNLSNSTKFIMYNYSRVSTLLQKHTTNIHSNYYPSLPEIDFVDFSLLCEENEQQIIEHLWQLKSLLNQFDNGVYYVKLHHFKPHLLVVYLSQLSRTFSTFYSRHHILGSNLPHLLPVMHARIYLLRAVQNVMKQVFIRLGVTPLNQM